MFSFSLSKMKHIERYTQNIIFQKKKGYNFIIDGRKHNQSVENNVNTYENVRQSIPQMGAY